MYAETLSLTKQLCLWNDLQKAFIFKFPGKIRTHEAEVIYSRAYLLSIPGHLELRQELSLHIHPLGMGPDQQPFLFIRTKYSPRTVS